MLNLSIASFNCSLTFSAGGGVIRLFEIYTWLLLIFPSHSLFSSVLNVISLWILQISSKLKSLFIEKLSLIALFNCITSVCDLKSASWAIPSSTAFVWPFVKVLPSILLDVYTSKYAILSLNGLYL